MSNNTSSNTSNNSNNNNNNNHHPHHHPHPHPHHNNSSRISNGTQACAACKYQRRKCAPDCVLAPYFPHDRQRQFLNAHKLFGVSNITKIIRNLNPLDKDIAMRTIIYQSDARAKDPVGGCYRIIRELHAQIEYCKAELDFVLQQLALCKAQHAFQNSQFMQMQQLSGVPVTEICSSSIPPPSTTTVPENHVDDGDVIQADPLTISCHDNNDHNTTNANTHIQANDSSYQNYHALLRCYYEDQENDQKYVHLLQQQQQQQQEEGSEYSSWPVGHGEETVLATSPNNNNDNNNNNNNQGDEYHHHVMMSRDFEEGGVIVPYDEERDYGSRFEDLHVDVSCCDIKRDGELKFDHHQTTDFSEEIILREEKVILEDQEDESFHHHIPEHDLRSAASLFTLTS